MPTRPLASSTAPVAPFAETAEAASPDTAAQIALAWLRRSHEHGIDEAGHRELSDWLRAAPANRQAYEDAQRLWLLAGLLPPRS